MKICLTLKIIVSGLFCVFPANIKGQACNCKKWNGRECKSCDVGCYLVSNFGCQECCPKCYSCSSRNNCDVCKTGYYGPKCDYDCVTCRDGSCTDDVCTYGCADGYYHFAGEGKCQRCPNGYFAGDGNCRLCPNGCVTCNSNSDCTLCISGRIGSYCQNCNAGYYLSYYGQCYQCNTNCLHDTCFDNSGECTDGCKNGWTGWGCNDACGPNCASCDRQNGTACFSCKPDYYGPSCNTVCHQLSGECLFNCSQLLCSQDGGTKDAQTSVNVAVIGGAIGFAVIIILVVSAVLVFIFLRKRRRKMSDPEERVTYDNNVNIADDNTDDNVYSVPDKKRIAKENVDKTQSTVQNTLPKLTPSNGLVTNVDVIYGNMGVVPVIPSGLSVDEPEDNVEELSEDEINIGDLEDDNTDDNVYSVPDKKRIAKENVDKTQSTDGDTPNAENYYNIYGLTRSRVQVDTLRDHVTSISTEDFEKEFKKLPKGLTRPYGDAVEPTNVSKNRYKGIYPYDSTRVKLTGNGGDYINASYIQGFEESEKTYIASLGPAEKFMKGYVEFWEMVWQEKVDKIVMLTNFMEESKMKCEKYWPDVGEHRVYGDINVHCMSDERYAAFTVTKLTMKKDSQVSSIHHFHFTAWSDQGTPENVVSLVEFRESVEHVPKITEGPTVVHCSAGIGRTGTYIALDILTRDGRSENYVDVYGCVFGLRGQRVLMVQNVEQYQFLHYALSHSLTNKCDQIASKDFCTVNTDEIQRQFQLLGTVNVLDRDEEKKAIEKNGKEKYKNRKGASIPGDAHRPRLFKYNQNSKSDYINAMYVDGYKEKHRYIVAQTPLPGMIEDFLGLVVQQNCSCIISLDPVGITSKQNIGDYLPDVNAKLYVGKVNVSCVHRDTTPEYILSKLNVCVQEGSTEEQKTILHYQYTEWPEESPVPSSTGSFLNLVRVSRRTVWEPNMPLEPVIIHCLAGGDRSGLFPVVANILEKINSEQHASIVNVVSQVRARRPRAIPNEEQFKYCYELASLFVENNSVYSDLS